LRQAEGGTPVADVCRQTGISEATFFNWKKKFAHLGVSELRRLRQIEDEHRRLKQLVADLTLDKHMLSETLRKKSEADAASRARRVVSHGVSGKRGAGVSAGPAQSDRVVSSTERKGSSRAARAHSRVGACAATLRVLAHLGAVAA
jgi:putative transposase